MGLFKHLFWLAPVLMGIFYYIATTQKEHESKMDKDIAAFDRDFAIEKSGGDKEHWKKVAVQKQQELEQTQVEAQAAKEKANEIYKRLEEAQKEHDFIGDKK